MSKDGTSHLNLAFARSCKLGNYIITQSCQQLKERTMSNIRHDPLQATNYDFHVRSHNKHDGCTCHAFRHNHLLEIVKYHIIPKSAMGGLYVQCTCTHKNLGTESEMPLNPLKQSQNAIVEDTMGLKGLAFES